MGGRGRAAKAVAVLLPIAVVAIGAWLVFGTHGGSRSPAPPAASMSPQDQGGSVQENTGDAAEGTPKIEFPEMSYDFGTVVQGAKVSHTFAVRNAGSGPLKLIDVGGS
jgi:hypothetical protein